MERSMLDKVELFSGLDEQQLSELFSKTVARQFPANAMIINEGDISDSLYIILSGGVKTFLSNEEGKEIVLNNQGPGEYFGEMALLDSAPRSASVMTTEQSKLLIISRPVFETFLKQHPATMLRILQRAISRIRALTDTVGSLAMLDVYGRVAKLLLQLSEKDGDQLIVRADLTQQDIASRIGASREMVSRILKDLRVGGYIRTGNRQIIITRELPSAW
jgi:CRP/FNR family cyclic AMP-dependent transcriptional regulator